MALIPFTQSRNDLYARIKCTCPDERHKGTNLSFLKTEIRLVGYDDDNFFDNVNAKPQDRACKCGRKYTVQWFQNGVEVNWENVV